MRREPALRCGAASRAWTALVAWVLLGVLAQAEPAPRPVAVDELLEPGSVAGRLGRDERADAALGRWLDALAPLAAGEPLGGAAILEASVAGKRAAPLASDDPLLVQARRWSLASAWTFHPEPLGVEPAGEPRLPWDTLRLVVDSLVARGAAGETEDLRAALRCARLALGATLLPEDELEGLALLDSVLLAVEADALERGDRLAAAAAFAATEEVAVRRSRLRDAAWQVEAHAVRVREGWFGPKLADVTPPRARSFGDWVRRSREAGYSRAHGFEMLRALWIVARVGRGETGEEARTALRREAAAEDAALAAVARWWLDQPWDGGAFAAPAGWYSVERMGDTTAWVHGPAWTAYPEVAAELIEQAPLGEAEGDAGRWLRSFAGDHRPRLPELGLEEPRLVVPNMSTVEPLPPEHPVLAEAEREVERSSCRLWKGEPSKAETARLHLFTRTLVKTWLVRAEAALADGRWEAAEADLLRSRRLLRLVAGEEGARWRSWQAVARPLVHLEVRIAHASGDEKRFLEAFRRWRTLRVAQLQFEAVRRVTAVRWSLRHGSPLEAIFRKPRVGPTQLAWILELTREEHGASREEAAHALWLLAHHGSREQRVLCRERLEEMAEDDDASLADLAARYLETEPGERDARGFEWDTFGMGVLERSPIPESWYGR